MSNEMKFSQRKIFSSNTRPRYFIIEECGVDVKNIHTSSPNSHLSDVQPLVSAILPILLVL